MTFSFPFTKLSTNEQATSTTLAFLNGFISTASSTATDLIITRATTTSATTTNLAFTGFSHSLLAVNGNGSVVASSTIGNNQLANSTISGIALGSSLNALTNGTTLNGSSYDGSSAISDWDINLGNANNWTALQTFTNASSTNLSSTIASTSAFVLSGAASGCATFSATGWLSSTGVACGSGGISWPFTKLSTNEQATSTTLALLNGFLSTSSSTLSSFTYTTATGTSATTTGLAISGLSSELLKVNSNGSVIEAIAGTDYQAAGSYALQATTLTIAGTAGQIASSAGAQDLSTNRTWTLSIPNSFNFGVGSTTVLDIGNAYFGTTATSSFNGAGNLFVVGSTTLQNFTAQNSTTTNATTTNFSTTNASTTNLFVSGAGGSTGCAQFSTTGLISNTGTACGSGGSNSKWATSSTDTLAIYPSNALRIGIGTTTPKWALQIASSTGAQLTLSDPSTLTNSHWSFRNAGGNLYFATSSASTFATTSTSAFTIIGSSGNVGVGTTSPFARFSVVGHTVLDSSLITFASSSASALTLDYRTVATSTVINNKSYAWTIATSTTATPIFRIDTTSSGAVTVSATTSIKGGFTLDDGAFNYDSYAGIVSVDSLSTGPMAFDTDAGILSWINMPSSTTTAGIVNSYSAQIDDTAVLTIYGTTTSSGVITYGSVGVGTTSPWRTFSVAGTVGFDGLTASTTVGNSLCLSNLKEVTLAVGRNCATASSLRFKEDILPLTGESGLAEVMALNPVSFFYKPDYLGSFASEPNWNGERVGFIAEEVQKIDPRLVTTDALGNTDTVRYELITPILAKAIQELYAKFTELRDTVLAVLDRLAGHDEKIAELEARVAQLEAMVNGAVTVTTVMPEPAPADTPPAELIESDPITIMPPAPEEPVSPSPDIISEPPLPELELSP